MSVYFIQSGEGGPIKIGWAMDPALRLWNLQAGNPEKLHLLCAIPGMSLDEFKYHKRFAHLWIRREWFRPEEDLMTEIRRLQARYPTEQPPDKNGGKPAAPKVYPSRTWPEWVAAETPLTAIPFSTRVFNKLRVIFPGKTLSDLADYTDDDLLECRNVGRAYVAEVRSALTAAGIPDPGRPDK